MRPAIIAVLVAAATAAPAAAHHSAGLVYVLEQQVEMEGVVTRFELGNPHLRIYFTPTGEESAADGAEPAEWMAEGGSRTVLVRRGWAADMLKPGDHIVVKGNPSRDGSNILHVEWLTTPDGRELFAEDVDPSAVATAAGRRRSAKQE